MKLDAGTISRRLLKSLRDVMASGGSPQERLDRVVKSIAETLSAEVCSCYVMRGGEILELFATYGLKKDAVHHTRLHVGEGLVGIVAQSLDPVSVADVWSHPNFAYKPETGEDVYKSFMGVPIIRSQRIIGVLVVQNNREREFTEEESETLETVAMVLAELLSSTTDYLKDDSLRPADGQTLRRDSLEGLPLSTGLGMGVAILHRKRQRITKLIAEDRAHESQRLKDSLVTMNEELDRLVDDSELGIGEHQEILEAYRMFARDRGWIAKIEENIQSGLTAEAAVQKVNDDMWSRMSKVDDSYLRERVHDLQDVADRLLNHLAGRANNAKRYSALPDHVVVVAHSMGPADLLDYDRSKIRALVLEEGTPTMHVSILARALNIPVVAKIKNVMSMIDHHDELLVDGTYGRVFIRPNEDVQELFYKRFEARQKLQAGFAADAELPSVTRDGREIGLYINAGLTIDMPYLQETGAKGVGLYRTEIPFMVRSQMPNVAEQAKLYGDIIARADSKPVIFRTLDVGADKVLPYWDGGREDNPAMGWRSIRITLDRRAILRQQLRAMIRGAAGAELYIMFPMVAELAELRAAKETVAIELTREKKRGGILPRKIYTGTMIEVPSAVYQLPAILKEVDFISVGTNDLAQFVFACDRGNHRLSNRYDLLSPPFIKVLGDISRMANDAGIPCSVCGEMAGFPIEAMALIGLGFTRLSMSGPAVGRVKSMLCTVDYQELAPFVKSLTDLPDQSVRSRLKGFARDHNVKLL